MNPDGSGRGQASRTMHWHTATLCWLRWLSREIPPIKGEQ